MKQSRLTINICREIAAQESLPVSEVVKAVSAYFDSIVSVTRKLPFDTPKRIYSKEAFQQNAPVINIPYIGRIGPVYSRYIKWRKEESENYESVPRKKVRQIHAKPIIEEEAKKALSGQKVNIKLLKERIPRGKYNRVWLVGADGKRRAAKQLLKNNKNV